MASWTMGTGKRDECEISTNIVSIQDGAIGESMEHNCIDEFEKDIREKIGDRNAALDITFDMKGDIFPALRYFYRRRKKDGSNEIRQRKGIIIPTYCPFCGVKYK